MHDMNNGRIDLNLLVVFAAIAETGSVTAAARKLALSQPAVSHALNRLRDVTKDALFVRGRAGLVPTPRAEAMVSPVRDALAVLGGALQPDRFDPGSAGRSFRLGVSDYALATLGQPLMRAVRAQAPGVGLEFRLVDERSLAMLETGALDGLFWGADAPEPPVQGLDLFREHLVGLVCARHPLAGAAREGALTLEDYLAFPHIVVSWREPHRSAVDAALDRLGRQRRVGVVSPNFTANIAALAGTDLIMSLPARMADSLASPALVQFSLPLELADYPYRFLWHLRTARDPGMIWLREIVRQAAAA